MDGLRTAAGSGECRGQVEEVVGSAFGWQCADHLLDWRAHYADLDYRIGELPEPESLGVVRLLKHLGLHFATLDFVVEKHTGRHLLVDVNPAGQWAWLEYQAGVPISAALADRLTEAP
ncbi:MAG TPA: hypothetical protein VLJ59_07565 [Mycobacteriales bacterium]|nr:hypothetical protein [Mycobacteriales bacterium]